MSVNQVQFELLFAKLMHKKLFAVHYPQCNYLTVTYSEGFNKSRLPMYLGNLKMSLYTLNEKLKY